MNSKYQFEIHNPTDEEQDVVLFGMNRYLLRPNFGSSRKVKIEHTKNKNYLGILQESANNSCDIHLIRVITDNELQNENDIWLEIRHKDKLPEYKRIYTEDSIIFNEYNKKCMILTVKYDYRVKQPLNLK